MSVELNHTIVHARNNRESAEFLARILGLEIGAEWGPFIPVATSNGVTLDFAIIPAESITIQHYAFLVSEDEFDAAFARIRQAGSRTTPTRTGSSRARSTTTTAGAGVYFMDPAGHGMEIITRPYGSGGQGTPSA